MTDDRAATAYIDILLAEIADLRSKLHLAVAALAAILQEEKKDMDQRFIIRIRTPEHGAPYTPEEMKAILQEALGHEMTITVIDVDAHDDTTG